MGTTGGGLWKTSDMGVSWQVISRYLLAAPSSWTEEVARFLMIWVTFLGAGGLIAVNSTLQSPAVVQPDESAIDTSFRRRGSK